MDGDGSQRKRLLWSVGVAAGAIVAATIAIPTYAEGPDRSGADGLKQRHQHAAAAAQAAALKSRSHDHSSHDHSDPATKNAVSRTTGVRTQDPTTAAEAAAARDAVAAQRAEPDPRIVASGAPAPRRSAPEDRYAMAGGCYAMQLSGGDWVRRHDGGYRASAQRKRNSARFHFQATNLGMYLLFDGRRQFLSRSGSEIESAQQASEDGDWIARTSGSSYVFELGEPDTDLSADADGDLVTSAAPAPFRLRLARGCAQWPEVDVNVEGRPFRGTSQIQEVRGYLDAHTHGMAYEFLGGEVHCGRPWHPYGVTAALVDCEDHEVANGNGAVLENILKNGTPTGSHDPVGWPTFKDWPAPDSLTHEGTYYKWMERAWRGGQRLFVNLLVENGQLCKAYPLKKPSHATCDEMDSIRRQARRMHQFERYIDAQSGGPGEGWYRIVTDPFQARRVINEGKMAVVMGIETSIVFGCTMKLDVPECDEASIDRQLDEVYDMGVRQMELVNKFDNALSGVAGDEGTTGVAVNSANFLETGSFWDMRTCPQEYPADVHDRNQITAPGSQAFSQRDGIFGAIQDQFGVDVPATPLYGDPPHCNQEALTSLGEHTIRGLVDRNMIFDPDHMSVSGRKASLDLVESLSYPGVVSSHSWSTPDAYPRIYELGGVVTPYAGDSTGFVDKWESHLGWADPRYYFGFGFGADINGLGAQGDPRGAGVANPVRYPFRGLGGVTVRKQHSGQRVYDINRDGVSHYGLYPDWVEDLRKIGGQRIVDDMGRGPEAYLQMWERALGVSNDGCRDASARRQVGAFQDLPRGASAEQVLRLVGQPHSRLDDTFGYCAKRPSGSTVRLDVVFDTAGRLARVS